jgi:hypothetical protein
MPLYFTANRPALQDDQVQTGQEYAPVPGHDYWTGILRDRRPRQTAAGPLGGELLSQVFRSTAGRIVPKYA